MNVPLLAEPARADFLKKDFRTNSRWNLINHLRCGNLLLAEAPNGLHNLPNSSPGGDLICAKRSPALLFCLSPACSYLRFLPEPMQASRLSSSSTHPTILQRCARQQRKAIRTLSTWSRWRMLQESTSKKMKPKRCTSIARQQRKDTLPRKTIWE